MKPMMCPRCDGGPLQRTEESTILLCPGCGKRIRLVQGAASGSGRSPARTGPEASGLRDGAPWIRPGLIAAGLVMGMAGLIFLMLGPLDQNARVQERRRLEELELRRSGSHAAVHELEKAIADLAARSQAIQETMAQQREQMDGLDRMRDQIADIHQQRMADLRTELDEWRQRSSDAERRLGGERVLDRSDLVAQTSAATVVVETDLGSGSGFIVDGDGRMVTNFHVIRLSSEIRVRMRPVDSDETMVLEPVAIERVDPQLDIAVLRLPPVPDEIAVDGGYPHLRLRSDRPNAGDPVIVIGSPGFGDGLLDYTVTTGIVSNNNRTIDGMPLLQTSAAINSGNSGGPMVDERGRVLGVVTLKGAGVESVGFAVRSDAVRQVLDGSAPHSSLLPEGLAAWEEEHLPMDALARRQLNYQPTMQIPFDTPVSDMLLTDHGLLVIQGVAGRLLRIDPDTGETLDRCELGGTITGVCLDDRERDLYIVAPDTRTLYRIGNRSLEVEERALLNRPQDSIAYLGGRERFLIAYSAGQPSLQPELLDGSSMGRDVFEKYNFGLVDNLVCADGDGRYLFMISQDGGTTLLEVLPRNRISRILDRITDGLALRASDRSGRQRIQSYRQELYRIYDESVLRVRMSNATLMHQGTLLPVVHAVGRDEMLFGRTVYRIRNDELERRLMIDEHPDKQLFARQPDMALAARLMDTIFAVSGDGRYAASGLHIYDLETGSVMKRLPAISALVVFSSDSRDLYVYDQEGSRLLIIEDWKDSLPAL